MPTANESGQEADSPCPHHELDLLAKIDPRPESKRWIMHIGVTCKQCGCVMEFIDFRGETLDVPAAFDEGEMLVCHLRPRLAT